MFSLSLVNKKVLIITYYWPPSGGSGVQRWLKFVKYLVSMGWEPYVFTPENPSFSTLDFSLLKDIPDSVEVMKLPIWEPYHLFFMLNKFLGRREVKSADFISTGKKSVIQKLGSWIRGNFFIPDARIFWVRPSVNFLIDFIKSNQIEKVITTGPPHSIHLIGLRLKKKMPGIKWVADFRDPWSEWDLLDTLSLTTLARKKHKALEQKVLTTADRVITIAPYHVKRLELLGGRPVDLITNGFDEADFPKVSKTRTEKFIIRHVGVVDELRDPRPFLNGVKQLCLENEQVRKRLLIEFIGNVNSGLKDEISNDPTLNSIVRFVGQLPHDELLRLYETTDVQLLVLAHTRIAPGNLPGKFFEYLASGNPIFGIGPADGDAAAILKETNAGVMCEREDQKKIKSSLLEFYDNWLSEKELPNRDVSSFTREKLTEQLVRILEHD